MEASGTATATPPAQGPNGGQPGSAPGQAPAQGATGGDSAKGFNWGLFPNVPETQRPLLEPHLRDVLGHVTKLEQQYAPYKPLIEQGVNPQELEGLQRFAQAYQQNPLGTWLQMAQQLQQQGAIHEFLDLEQVQALAQGQDLDEEPGMTGDPAEPGAGTEDPRIAQLTQQVEQLTQIVQSDMSQRQQRVQDGLLKQSLGQMKSTLKEAGFPEGVLTDEMLTAALITHRGDVTKATESFTQTRDGLLKGHVETATADNNDLDMPKGSPKPPEKGPPPRDAFAATRGPAQQFLESAKQGAAQQ